MRRFGGIALLLLAGCATTAGQRPGDDDDFDFEAAFRHIPASQASLASGEPLGTVANPIRAIGPAGQRDYLAHLRCDDGLPPAFHRRGSGGPGGYGKMVDFYEVTCRGQSAVTLVLDLYHCRQDDRAPPGFDLVPRIGAFPPTDDCPTP